MKDIALIGCARQQSSRVFMKMTRSFGDTSLFDIYLQKLENIGNMSNPFNNHIFMAVNENDKEFWSKKNSCSNVDFIQRDDISVAVNTGDLHTVHRYINDMDEYDYFAIVNGCYPFFNENHIIQIGNFFKYTPHLHSLTCAKYRYNYFIDGDTGKILNLPSGQKDVDTKKVPPTLELVHAMHIFKREYFLDNDFYWPWKKDDPFFYVIDDDKACMDIDTEFDFQLAECMWEKKNE